MSFRPGAIGVLTGTLTKVEFKTTPKGKRWAAFSLKRGKQIIKMKSFADAVVVGLEMFVEGEEISVFGKLSTQTNNDKHYTNFTVLKLYDSPEEDSGVTVSGEVTSIKAHEYGFDVWVDTTENESYPETVKFQVNKGVKLPFEEGDVIASAKLEPRGKFCFWTLDTGTSGEREKPTDFKGKKIKDLSEAIFEKAANDVASAEEPIVAPSAGDSIDDDFEF
jgi:hypothetical protein